MFQVYGIGQALIPVLPPPLHFQSTPTVNQTNYEIGQLVYTGTSGSYTFYLYAGAGVWELLDVSTGVLDSLTTSDSTVVTPTAGNINLSGVGSITTVGSGSTATVELTGLTDHAILVGAGTTTITKLAVGATGTVLVGNTGLDPSFTTTPSVTTLTATTIHGTTIDTNVAAAELSLNGTTIAATGSDTNVSLNLTTKGSGSLIFAQSKAGIDQNMQITNSDNTAAAGNAGLQLAVGGSTSTGDPYVSFQISGVAASTMTMGLDNSASDLFVISNSTTLGTSNALTLTQAGALNATTSITAGTALTASLGNITATNGNIVRGTAGNKDVYTSVASTTTAGANSAGTVTLTGGTATISTTAVTASSIIRLTRQGVGVTGANPLGMLSVGTIVASTSFVINAWSATDATALAATDVSIIGWEIVN